MNELEKFSQERKKDIEQMSKDDNLHKQSLEWMIHADKYKYTYNYTWMGRPIIKFPNDMILQQEIMWDIKPDLIIETGIAHGGSVLFSASLQKMMEIENSEVVAIDIDIRDHNKKEIEKHPMFKYVTMYEGDSTSEVIFNKVSRHTINKRCVMVILDSNHTHEHVLKELELYSSLVTINSYILVLDTFVEYFPKKYYDRPWDVGNNPMTAMKEFIEKNKSFKIDQQRVNKLAITEMFDGVLKKIK